MTRPHAADFPWLGPEDHFEFPDCSAEDAGDIVAVGGNLSPGMLLSAYRQGIFPWFDDKDPILWWCPDPRCVLYLDELHVSRSMKRVLGRGAFTFSLDRAFGEVIRSCATVNRRGQSGTWITNDIQQGYRRLHELGQVHSCEAWQDGELVGGLYGVAIGRMFFGESMFSLQPNASKAALVTLVRFLTAKGYDILDAQQETAHMISMGARAIPRAEFLEAVSLRVLQPGLTGPWADLLREDGQPESISI